MPNAFHFQSSRVGSEVEGTLVEGAAEGVLVGSGERAGLEALEDACEGVSFVVNALLDELVVAADR